MSKSLQTLGERRLELLQRAALQRQELRDHAGRIQSTISSVANGLSPARWLGASPLLLAGGVATVLVLGRGRVLRTLGTGVAMVGLLRRYRSTFQIIGEFASNLLHDQSVRRSR